MSSRVSPLDSRRSKILKKYSAGEIPMTHPNPKHHAPRSIHQHHHIHIPQPQPHISLKVAVYQKPNLQVEWKVSRR